MDVACFSPGPADLKGFEGAAIAMNEEGAEPTARPETFHMITINVRIHFQNIKHSMYTAARSTALGNFSTVRSHWSTEFWGRDLDPDKMSPQALPVLLRKDREQGLSLLAKTEGISKNTNQAGENMRLGTALQTQGRRKHEVLA